MTVYLLASVDELITALFREVLVTEETFGTVYLLLCTLLVLIGAVLVLLRNTVEKIVTGVPELVHKTTFLRLSIRLVLRNGIAADSVGSVFSVVLSFVLPEHIYSELTY